jgi:hypothetical protein
MIIIIAIQCSNHRVGAKRISNSILKTLSVAILLPTAGLAKGLSRLFLGFRNYVDESRRIEEEEVLLKK